MMIHDNIYGTTKITELVLLELIASKPILRLKKISQYGVPDEFYFYPGYSRYEHSVGVMILLRKLGAGLEEQIAGLLHDVSHFAFSHTAEWIFKKAGDIEEDFHDFLKREFVEKTEIPAILKKHGFDIDYLLDEGNFPLLERDIPDLCADRIDYVIRQFKYFENPAIVDGILKSLIVVDNKIAFNDKKVAREFAEGFVILQTTRWADEKSVKIIHLLVETFRLALDKGIIKEADFHRDDDFILAKLKSSKSKEILNILNTLSLRDQTLIKKRGETVYKKFRHVDPMVFANGPLKRLSEVDPEFKAVLREHREINQRGIEI